MFAYFVHVWIVLGEIKLSKNSLIFRNVFSFKIGRHNFTIKNVWKNHGHNKEVLIIMILFYPYNVIYF